MGVNLNLKSILVPGSYVKLGLCLTVSFYSSFLSAEAVLVELDSLGKVVSVVFFCVSDPAKVSFKIALTSTVLMIKSKS